MNSKRYLLLLLLLCAGVGSLAPTPPRSKARLLELVVAPKIDLQFNFGYDARTTLSDLTNEANLSDQISSRRRDVRQSPNDTRLLIQLGWLLDKNSETNEARRFFQQAATMAEGRVTARPNDGLALVNWGDACDELDKKELAEKEYRMATQVSSNDWRCWAALGQFLDRQTRLILYPTNFAGLLASSSPEIARPTPDKMERAIKSKTEAALCFDRAVSSSPQEADVYLLRAWHKCGDEAHDYLLRYYRNELKLDRKALGTLIGMGIAKSAIPDLQKAATLQPQVCQLVGLAAWFELVAIAMTPLTGGTETPTQFSDFPESSQRIIKNAIAQLTELSQGNDTKRTALALEYLGILRAMTQENEELAVADLRRAVALNPDREQAWDMLLASILESASPEEFAAVCEDRLKHKKSARNHLIFAKALFRRGSFEKATGEAKSAIKLETNNVPAQLMLCAALVRQDKGEAGEEELASAFAKAAELVKSTNAPERGDWWLVYGLNVAIAAAINDNVKNANAWLDTCQKEFPDDERIKEIRNALP